MSQITDEIWVGSYADACDEQYLIERKINHILCCADEFALRAGFPYSDNRIGHKILLRDDYADEKTFVMFLEGAQKLNEWILSGNRVMVHCFAGISRSVSVVITYFMVYKGWSFDVAYSHLKQRRYQTKIHPGFIPILKEIETSFKQPPQLPPLTRQGGLEAQQPQ